MHSKIKHSVDSFSCITAITAKQELIILWLVKLISNMIDGVFKVFLKAIPVYYQLSWAAPVVPHINVVLTPLFAPEGERLTYLKTKEGIFYHMIHSE